MVIQVINFVDYSLNQRAPTGHESAETPIGNESRSERFKGRKFTSRRDPAKKESSSHGDKEKWEEKRDLTCFKCKKSGHIKYDCPLYKSEAKRRMKKTMMATWSKSKESSEEENEKEVANMCFMVIDDLDEVNSNFSDESF